MLKMQLLYDLAIPRLKYESLYLYKDLHTNIYSSFICNIKTGNNPNVLQQIKREINCDVFI